MATFDDEGRFNLAQPLTIFVVGAKGRGKSTCCQIIAQDFPGDVGVIDPTGDVAAATGWQRLEELDGGWPAPPEAREGRQPAGFQRVVFCPDQDAADYRDQVNEAVRIFRRRGQSHGRLMLWVDEGYEVFPSGRVLPAAQALIRQNRHDNVFVLVADPRWATIDPTLRSQADVVYIYGLTDRDDREALCKAFGVKPGEPITDDGQGLDEVIRRLPPHHYLRWDRNPADLSLELLRFPPLPRVPPPPPAELPDPNA